MRLATWMTVTLVVVGIVIAGCNDRRQALVPRRTAYPRLSVPEPYYRPIEGLPLSFEVNLSTEVIDTAVTISSAEAGSRWVNVAYPSLGVTIYCTLTPVDSASIGDVTDNRIERLSLNTGGAVTELVELINDGGFDCRIAVTRSDSPTPVQFIATDHREWVVSGSAYLEAGRNNNPDSVAPIVDMLERDIRHTVSTLHR